MNEFRKHITPEQSQFLMESASDFAMAVARKDQTLRTLAVMLGLPERAQIVSIDYAAGEVFAVLPPEPQAQEPEPVIPVNPLPPDHPAE